jgi:hypothetical protein
VRRGCDRLEPAAVPGTLAGLRASGSAFPRSAAVARVTAGHADGCLHPAWTWKLGYRFARGCGARTLWVPDHYVDFFPPRLWNAETTPAAKIVPPAIR